MKKIKDNIIGSETYKSALTTLRKTKMQDSVPVLRVMQALYKKLSENNVHQQASAIAFSFMLSLFPAILFLFSLIPYIASGISIPPEELTERLMDLLDEGMPSAIYDFMKPTILDIIGRQDASLLSFGFLFALYAASSGVVEMMHTFNESYAFSEKRGFLKKRLIAIGLAFLFAFLLIFAVVVIIVGKFILDFLHDQNLMNDDFTYYSVVAVRLGAAFLVFYIGISYVYYIAPAVHKQWRFFSMGSTVAAILVILSTQGFSYYLSNFANYNKLYGSIGTLIALMIWFYVLAWVLLLGFSLNACTQEAKIAYDKEMKMRLEHLDELNFLEEEEVVPSKAERLKSKKREKKKK